MKYILRENEDNSVIEKLFTKNRFNGFERLMRRGVKLKHRQIRSLKRDAVYYTYQLNINKTSLSVGHTCVGCVLFKDYIEMYCFL